MEQAFRFGNWNVILALTTFLLHFFLTDASLKLSEILPPNYDKLDPPKGENGGPVLVDVAVSILTLRGLDATQLSYETDIFFHQYWKDPRVKLPKNYSDNKVIMDPKWRDELWTPDTFFKNSRDGKVHNIIIPYTYMTLDNESTIFFAARLSLKLNCAMDLHKFPHDQQECEISIMSLQHSTDKMLLKWKKFYITKNTLLPQYKIVGNSFGDCTRVYDVGTFSCLVGQIKLKRRIGYYLINRFVPSILIVVMSFITFWVPPTAYPARVTLSVTSILTIVTQQYQSSMPSVSYVMAINVWIMGCIGFVFFTLLEYAVVVVLMDHKPSDDNSCTGLFYFGCCKRKSSWELKKDEDGEMPGENRPPPVIPKHMQVDRASRFFFPLCFIIFFTSYWLYFAVLKIFGEGK